MTEVKEVEGVREVKGQQLLLLEMVQRGRCISYRYLCRWILHSSFFTLLSLFYLYGMYLYTSIAFFTFHIVSRGSAINKTRAPQCMTASAMGNPLKMFIW